VHCSPGRFRLHRSLLRAASLSCRLYSYRSCLFLTAWLFSQFYGPAKRPPASSAVASPRSPFCSPRSSSPLPITTHAIRPFPRNAERLSAPMFEGSIYHIFPAPLPKSTCARLKRSTRQPRPRPLRAEIHPRRFLGSLWPLVPPPRRSRLISGTPQPPRSPSVDLERASHHEAGPLVANLQATATLLAQGARQPSRPL